MYILWRLFKFGSVHCVCTFPLAQCLGAVVHIAVGAVVLIEKQYPVIADSGD